MAGVRIKGRLSKTFNENWFCMIYQYCFCRVLRIRMQHIYTGLFVIRIYYIVFTSKSITILLLLYWSTLFLSALLSMIFYRFWSKRSNNMPEKRCYYGHLFLIHSRTQLSYLQNIIRAYMRVWYVHFLYVTWNNIYEDIFVHVSSLFICQKRFLNNIYRALSDLSLLSFHFNLSKIRKIRRFRIRTCSNLPKKESNEKRTSVYTYMTKLSR